MLKVNQILASFAVSALVFAASAQAAVAGSAQSGGGLAGEGAQICRVKVSRSSAPGAFDVTRQVLSNGKCVCRVSTGPRSQGGSAESALAGLQLRRSCADAPLASADAAGNGGSGLGRGTLIAGGLLAAGIVIAVVASDGSKSP